MTILLAALLLQAVAPKPAVETWTISGRILNSDGTPAAKTFVGVIKIDDPLPAPDSALLAGVDTDAAGNYQLRGLPAGKYRIMAGIINQATWFPGVLEEGNGNVVVLTGNANVDHIDFPTIRDAVLEIDGRRITQVLKKFELVHGGRTGITKTITALRTRLNARYLAQTDNAILMRESPAKIAFGERMVKDFDKSTVVQAAESVAAPAGSPDPFGSGIGFDDSGNVFFLEPNALSDLDPGRARLQPAGPVTLKIKDGVRAVYEAIAGKTDLNLVFDPDVGTSPAMEFTFDGVDVRAAFDRVGQRSSTYWQAIDSRTVMIAPNTTAAHRDYEPQTFETFYLTNGTGVRLIEIVTMLRTLLNLRYLATAPAVFAISIRDTPAMVALAGKMIADLDKPDAAAAAPSTNPQPPRAPLPPSEPMTVDASGNLIESGATGARKVSPNRSQLQVKPIPPVSFEATADGRECFQMLAKMAEINVQFDPSFAPGVARCRVKEAEVFDALDLLALQTKGLWQTSAERTIMVVPNTSANRQKLMPQVQATISFVHAREEAAMNAILTAFRALVQPRDIELNAAAHSITLTETPNMIIVAQKIMADLDRPNR